jgi:multimeric flavodoxin WrbA
VRVKIVIIYGNARSGSTWHYANLLLEALKRRGSVEVTEFSAPNDMPDACVGCFNCFTKGEDRCPHADKVAPIAEAIASADVIVLASPIYAMDVSGGMKSLLDHLCYRWLVHRPNPELFDAIGVAVSTTAGAGLSNADKTLRNSLRFWGLKRAFSMKMAVAAADWSEVSDAKKARMRRTAERTADKVLRAMQRPFGSPMRRIVFLGVRGMMKNNTWGTSDREYWLQNGWLDGANPFKAARS